MHMGIPVHIKDGIQQTSIITHFNTILHLVGRDIASRHPLLDLRKHMRGHSHMRLRTGSGNQTTNVVEHTEYL